MAYTPKDWVTGEVITEQALDHIEQGIANIGGGVAMLTVTTDETDSEHLGKSYNDIVAMIENGKFPIAVKTVNGIKEIMLCVMVFPGGEVEGGEAFPYQVGFLNYGNVTERDKYFSADTATAELTYTSGGGGGGGNG